MPKVRKKGRVNDVSKEKPRNVAEQQNEDSFQLTTTIGLGYVLVLMLLSTSSS